MKLNIPEDLSEIKLYQYQKFLLIEEPTNVDILSCFLDLTIEQIDVIALKDVNDIAKMIMDCFENRQDTFKQTFKLNGVHFGFIPNLDDISYGENKDITSYINDWKSMHKAMAVLFRPIDQKQGSKYRIEQYKGSHIHSELMKQMPLDIVFGSMVFFYNLTNELLKAIPNYLQGELTREQMQGQISVENGEVIANYIHSLKATLEDLTRLQTLDYIRA
jgi:hypothetical protein